MRSLFMDILNRGSLPENGHKKALAHRVLREGRAFFCEKKFLYFFENAKTVHATTPGTTPV